METPARVCLFTGIIFLLLTVVNGYTTEIINPTFQRSQVLAGISSIFLILISILWTEIKPKPPEQKVLTGKNGFFIHNLLAEETKIDLAWSSQLILTSSSACTVLLYWQGKTILHRGLIAGSEFVPGDITKSCMETKKSSYLINTRSFPGRVEFDSIVENMPSILVKPIGTTGALIVGGFKDRSFSSKDQLWIDGICKRIHEKLLIDKSI